MEQEIWCLCGNTLILRATFLLRHAAETHHHVYCALFKTSLLLSEGYYTHHLKLWLYSESFGAKIAINHSDLQIAGGRVGHLEKRGV